MVRLTSSTACRVRLDIALPILKCRVRPSVRSSVPVPSWADGAPESAGAGAPEGATGRGSTGPGPGAAGPGPGAAGWTRRAAGSPMARLLPGVQEAPDERAVHLIQL